MRGVEVSASPPHAFFFLRFPNLRLTLVIFVQKYAPDGKTEFKCPKDGCCEFTKPKTPAPSKPSNHTKTPAPSKPSNHTKTPAPSKPSNHTKTPAPSKPSNNTKTPAPSKPSNNTKTPAPSKPVSTAAPTEADGLIPELIVYSKDKWDAAVFTKDLAEAVTKASKKNVSSDRFKLLKSSQAASKLKNYKVEVTLKLSVKVPPKKKHQGNY